MKEKMDIYVKNETYFYAGETPILKKNLKKINEKKEKRKQQSKEKLKKKKKTGALDVPNFPQDQASEEAWQRKEGKNKSGGLNEKG